MKILDKADELGRLLRDSDEFIKFRDAEIKFLNDQELQAQIKEYDNLKRNYLNSKDSQLEERINNQYDELFKNSTFKEYTQSKKEFENLLYTINEVINYHIDYQQDNCCAKSCTASDTCSKNI